MEHDRLMTLKDAAAFCQISYPVFRDWFARGVIKSVPVRPGSSRRKVFQSEVVVFLAWLRTDEAERVAKEKRIETS